MSSDVKVNSLGTNEAIKFNFNEELLKQNGFKFMDEPNYPEKWPIPPHWYYNKFFSYKSLEITFSVNYYVDPYKGSQFCIDVIDDDFCQPYDYQRMLKRNPEFIYAKKVWEFVENEMEKLQASGIISGHIRGEYI